MSLNISSTEFGSTEMTLEDNPVMFFSAFSTSLTLTAHTSHCD